MGWGDDLIFLGEAQNLHEKTGKKIYPMYDSGYSVLYQGAEFLSSKLGGDTVSLNARDTDQYSDYHVDYYVKKKIQTSKGVRLIWNDEYKPKPYKLPFSEKEEEKIKNLGLGEEILIVNPDAKTSFFSKNKAWDFDNWQELTTKLSKHIQVVRVMPGGDYKEPELKDAINIKIEDIRLNLCLASKAKLGVTFNGLLEHLWAGYGVPCVSIRGDLLSSNLLMYPTVTPLALDENPCGATYECDHCKKANKRITVDMVYKECLKILSKHNLTM